MDLGKKIKRLAEEKGASNADIARAAGVTRSAVTKWFNGTSQPKAEVVAKLAKYFDYPLDALLSVDEILGDVDTKKAIHYERTYEVAAGNGRLNEDYESDESGIDPEYSRVRICGDSMYPSLHDGDIVKVKHVTEDITPSDFAIIKVNGDESTCKHIEVTNEGIWLRAENKDVFEDKFYTVQDVLTLPVTIIGKAITIIKRDL